MKDKGDSDMSSPPRNNECFPKEGQKRNLLYSDSPINAGRTIMNKLVTFIAILPVAVILTGCSASAHVQEVRADDTDRITVGTVQREIHLGMSAAGVAEVLGSPNIVTTDENRQETWIWDKISSEVAYSRSSGTVVGLVFGSSGAGLGTGSKEAGAESSSQRTLTVIIKFDDDNLVRDFSYHTSRF
jgi:outer membrane protein assembly factor BamE (lipoprotein component of BamABCDE complex)